MESDGGGGDELRRGPRNKLVRVHTHASGRTRRRGQGFRTTASHAALSPWEKLSTGQCLATAATKPIHAGLLSKAWKSKFKKARRRWRNISTVSLCTQVAGGVLSTTRTTERKRESKREAFDACARFPRSQNKTRIIHTGKGTSISDKPEKHHVFRARADGPDA